MVKFVIIMVNYITKLDNYCALQSLLAAKAAGYQLLSKISWWLRKIPIPTGHLPRKSDKQKKKDGGCNELINKFVHIIKVLFENSAVQHRKQPDLEANFKTCWLDQKFHSKFAKPYDFLHAYFSFKLLWSYIKIIYLPSV